MHEHNIFLHLIRSCLSSLNNLWKFQRRSWLLRGGKQVNFDTAILFYQNSSVFFFFSLSILLVVVMFVSRVQSAEKVDSSILLFLFCYLINWFSVGTVFCSFLFCHFWICPSKKILIMWILLLQLFIKISFFLLFFVQTYGL